MNSFIDILINQLNENQLSHRRYCRAAPNLASTVRHSRQSPRGPPKKSIELGYLALNGNISSLNRIKNDDRRFFLRMPANLCVRFARQLAQLLEADPHAVIVLVGVRALVGVRRTICKFSFHAYIK